MKNSKIHIVDDEKAIRQLIIMVLRHYGFTNIVESENGDEALKKLVADPDTKLLITDIDYPGTMDGNQLTRKVIKLIPGIKIVQISGRHSNHTLHRGDVFLQKPFDMRSLIFHIEALLQE